MKPSPILSFRVAAVGVALITLVTGLSAGSWRHDSPFVNSLEMEFVPVPGTEARFSVWETRVQDYQVFAQETGGFLKEPPHPQQPDHPVVQVTWDEANAFCNWLTARERAQGALDPGLEYRLPTDLEWSLANGLDEDLTLVGITPQGRDSRIESFYAWGRSWPPAPNAGNFGRAQQADPYPFTAPAGSFEPNAFGLYDLAGNVTEWCSDRYNPDRPELTLRGSSWNASDFTRVHEVSRRERAPSYQTSDRVGFRCVLAPTKAPSLAETIDPQDPWRNAIGMEFIPAGKSGLLWSVHETRWKDYFAYVKSRGKHGASLYATSLLREKPLANVTWHDAVAFCEWLTQVEIQSGKIPPDARYRLPTVAEWETVFETRFIKARSIGAANQPARNKHGLYETGANRFEWMQDGPAGSDDTRSIRAGLSYVHLPAAKPEIPVEPQIAPPPNIPDPPELPSMRRTIDIINLNVASVNPDMAKVLFSGPPSYRDQVRAYPYRMRNWRMNNYYKTRNWRLQHEPAIRKWNKERAIAIRKAKAEWNKRHEEVTTRVANHIADASFPPKSRDAKIVFRCVLDLGRQGMVALR